MTYNKVTQVCGLDSRDLPKNILNEAELQEGSTTKYTSTSDYVVETNGQEVTIKFIRRGALSAYTQVCVDLEATLTENAVVGDLGNPNNADLKYSNFHILLVLYIQIYTLYYAHKHFEKHFVPSMD